MNNEEINIFRKEITNQLKNSNWEPYYYGGNDVSCVSSDSFQNDIFIFKQFSSSKKWYLYIKSKNNNNTKNSSIPVFDIIPSWKFYFYRIFFVSISLFNYKIEQRRKWKIIDKENEKEKLSLISKSFFDNNKSLLRNEKLKELLNDLLNDEN